MSVLFAILFAVAAGEAADAAEAVIAATCEPEKTFDVSIVEVNEFTTGDGSKPQLQVIFWDVEGADLRLTDRGWLMNDSLIHLPYHDGEHWLTHYRSWHGPRTVRAKYCWTTCTNHDPEAAHRCEGGVYHPLTN